MSQKTADVKAMLDWLATCPLITTLNNGDVVLGIDYLGTGEPDMVPFSLESTPSAPLLAQYFGGSSRAKNYILASRMGYSEDQVQQAANSSFWEDFAEWVEVQSRARKLPVLGDGRRAEKVVCLSPGYILSQDSNTCRFQIQLQLQYYQEGR